MATAKAEEKTKVDVQQAAHAAMRYFQKLFPTVKRFTLEEVELSDDGKFWMITLGYEIPRQSSVQVILAPPTTKYKVFKVDVGTGEVVAMKIRSLQ
jgi:hypothetical protein